MRKHELHECIIIIVAIIIIIIIIIIITTIIPSSSSSSSSSINLIIPLDLELPVCLRVTKDTESLTDVLTTWLPHLFTTTHADDDTLRHYDGGRSRLRGSGCTRLTHAAH